MTCCIELVENLNRCKSLINSTTECPVCHKFIIVTIWTVWEEIVSFISWIYSFLLLKYIQDTFFEISIVLVSVPNNSRANFLIEYPYFRSDWIKVSYNGMRFVLDSFIIVIKRIEKSIATAISTYYHRCFSVKSYERIFVQGLIEKNELE